MKRTFKRIELHAVDHCNLACVGCNHASPYLAKSFFDIEDYLPWIDLLWEAGHRTNCFAVSGGEPFLLKEKINTFCAGLVKYKRPIQLYTNAFWLFQENALDKYEEALSSITDLQISLYPPFVEKHGIPKIKAVQRQIREKFGIKVFNNVVKGVKEFADIKFYHDPVETSSEDECYVRHCTQLRPTGMMYRCPVGLYFGTEKSTKEFEQSPDMLFNLKEIESRDLRAWASKWPLDNCSYCSGIENRVDFIPWKSVIQKNKVTPK